MERCWPFVCLFVCLCFFMLLPQLCKISHCLALSLNPPKRLPLYAHRNPIDEFNLVLIFLFFNPLSISRFFFFTYNCICFENFGSTVRIDELMRIFSLRLPFCWNIHWVNYHIETCNTLWFKVPFIVCDECHQIRPLIHFRGNLRSYCRKKL